MSERRALESAVKWLHGNDGERAAEPPLRSIKRGARKQKSTLRHDRKCSVCRHPERAEIEREFVRWRSAESIAKNYGIAHHSSIYRHAHAAGLFAQRATHIRLSLAPLIEQAMVVPATADSVVRAVALCARLNDDGEWIDTPKTIIHQSRNAASSPPSRRSERAASALAHHAIAADSNRESVSTSS